MSEEGLTSQPDQPVANQPRPVPLSTQFPLLLGNFVDGVTVQDRTGRLVYANEAAARSGGYPSIEALLAAPVGEFLERFELFDEHGAPFPIDQLPGRRVLRGEAPPETTLQVRDKDSGALSWSTIKAIPILDEAGSVQFALNIFQDITTRKRAEEALRESEERFRVMADTAPVMVWMSGTDALCDFFNRPWLEFTGRTITQELGYGWTESVHPADYQRCLDTYLSAFESRRSFEREYRLRRADGEYRWVLDAAMPRFTAAGDFLGFTGSCIDITERRRAEEGLRFLLQASELLHQSLDYQDTLTRLAHLAVPDVADWCAVDIVQEDGTLRRLAVAHTDPAKVRWAVELQRRYPSDPQAPVGVPKVIRTGSSDFFAEISDEMLVQAARNAEHLELLRTVGFRSALIVPLTTRDRILGAITLVTAESGRHYDRADLALTEDLGRRAAAAIENARLFREVHQAREEIEIQAEELEATAAELEAANEELLARTAEAEAANRAKSQFLAMMSHELRTPLNAIAGYAELLDMEIHGPITDAQREDLRKIRFSQNHLLTIINDVLNFAKLETGRLSFAIEEVPLASMLAGLFDLVEPLLRVKEQHYEYSCADPALTVRADPEKLRQILLNLLSNATKFTPAQGRITVDCQARTHEVEVRVRDTGRGIPPERLQEIFEPFAQVDPGLTREVSGIGLGLTISRDLARAMGGDLRAESRLDHGSTFMLTLPRGSSAARRFRLATELETQ